MNTKEALLQMVKRCYSEGILTGNNGNISIYDRGLQVMSITPTSIAYNEMEAEGIVCITLDGEQVSGTRKPSSEWRMHAAVYKEKPETAAQIHTHSTYASSFAVCRMGIPCFMVEIAPLLGGDVKVADFAPPGTEEVGHAAVKALKGRNACLLASHGALIVGETLEQAYARAVCLEEVAKIYSIARGNGTVYSIESLPYV